MDKLRYPLISNTINTERAKVVDKVWTWNVNHMKIECVRSLRWQFYWWKWIVTLKKWEGVGKGVFYPLHEGWCFINPPPYAAGPHAIHVPLKVEGYTISLV